MKRILQILLAGTALTLSAQQGTAWVAGYVGDTVFKSDANLKDSMHYGLGLGHWYTDSWGLDLRAIRNDLKFDQNPLNIGTGKETHLLLSGLYNLRPGANNWYPYLAAGVGGTNLDSPYSGKSDSATRFNYHVGAGLMGRPAENVFLDVSVKGLHVDQAHTEYLASLGLG